MSVVTGYCWPQSVAPGEDVNVHLSSQEPHTITVEIVRDGLDPEVVWRNDVIEAGPQAVPSDAVEAGFEWSPTLHLSVGEDWRSGMYLVRTGEDPPSAWFVVRPSVPSPDVPLLKLATNTWNAYNEVGGQNLYTGAVAVSPQRPLGAGFLSKPEGPGSRVVDDLDDFLSFAVDNELSLWHAMAGWAGQERRFVLWAEAAGFDLDYAIDADLDHPDGADLLVGRKLVLSVGHDEYWTWGMRDRIEDFVAEGGNVAFLSGNTAYWQVRIEDADKVMVAYKHRFREDPVMGTDREHLVTSMWSDPLIGRPEDAMTGVSFTRGGYHRLHLSSPRGAGGYEVQRPGHWLLEGTGLERGDLLGAGSTVVGYECDGTEMTVVDGQLTATGRNATPPGFTVVGTAPARMFDEHSTPLPVEPGNEYELEFHAQRLLGGDTPENLDRLRYGYAVLGEWSNDAGGTVVTTGCTDWAHGLDDPLVSRVTRNVLGRLAGLRGTPASPTVANLEAEFSALDELCSTLDDADWDTMTGCPGWSVKDNLSHIIDFESAALGWPRPLHEFTMPDHARNALGEVNEAGVDARRWLDGAVVLDEFRRVVESRVPQLWSLTSADLEHVVDTPAGQRSRQEQLRMRVMDCWSHEQDIRRALGRKGHDTGPVVDESIDYFMALMPYVVGKVAAAPEGSVVRFVLVDSAGGSRTDDVEVVDGRARLAAASTGAATVTLTMPVVTFAALVGGRSDAPDDAVVDGTDGGALLGEAVLAGLAVMP